MPNNSPASGYEQSYTPGGRGEHPVWRNDPQCCVLRFVCQHFIILLYKGERGTLIGFSPEGTPLYNFMDDAFSTTLNQPLGLIRNHQNKFLKRVTLGRSFTSCAWICSLPWWNSSILCRPIVWVWSQIDFRCSLITLLGSWDFLLFWWIDGKLLQFSPMGMVK